MARGRATPACSIRTFPTCSRDYAAKVAERYPWIDIWTPVNEPLTTARFSCLYGHWYPHTHRHRRDVPRAGPPVRWRSARGDAARSARSIPRREAAAPPRIIGKTFATRSPCSIRRDHENRPALAHASTCSPAAWCPDTRFIAGCRNKAASEEVLAELATGAATPGPDRLRPLSDERALPRSPCRTFPRRSARLNGHQTYVDVEAVRVAKLSKQLGPRFRLKETWDRYNIPIVITEVHHGCTRDEQVRWLHQVWTEAEAARREGVDLRAVTLWAVFGMMDWRSLLTRREGAYDVGCFDTRSEVPRPTLLAKTASQLGRGETFDHPLLDLPGWWRRPGRSPCAVRVRHAPHAARRAPLVRS